MMLVVKLSGKVLELKPLRRALCVQIRQLLEQGHRLAVVHGAGKQLTEFCRRLGVATVQHQGRRITDEATLEAAKMVFSAVNLDLVSELVACGVSAVGLSAFDGGLTASRRRPPLPILLPGAAAPQPVDFGLVAEIVRVDPGFLNELWELGRVPVVCSLCADLEGQILNINADTLAAELAAAVRADRLISLSDVDGIYLDPSEPATLIPRLTPAQARRHIESGAFTEGMVPKVETGLRALERSVQVFQVAGGVAPTGLLDAVQSDCGTLLVAGD
jgi:acetylglutamate kinase